MVWHLYASNFLNILCDCSSRTQIELQTVFTRLFCFQLVQSLEIHFRKLIIRDFGLKGKVVGHAVITFPNHQRDVNAASTPLQMVIVYEAFACSCERID